MKDHAWIDYEIFGRRYRFTGEWPEDPEIEDALGAAVEKMNEENIPGGVEEILRTAGATIIEVHSIRPDGSIQGLDFPDIKIY